MDLDSTDGRFITSQNTWNRHVINWWYYYYYYYYYYYHHWR